LDQEFNREKDLVRQSILLPKKAVKVNESWKIDPQMIIKKRERDYEGVKIDADKTVATGKLLKAYQKDGRQFGVMETHIEMPFRGAMMLDNDTKAEIDPGAKMIIATKVDACIDGKSTSGDFDISTRMSLNATFKGLGGENYKATIIIIV